MIANLKHPKPPRIESAPRYFLVGLLDDIRQSVEDAVKLLGLDPVANDIRLFAWACWRRGALGLHVVGQVCSFFIIC